MRTRVSSAVALILLTCAGVLVSSAVTTADAAVAPHGSVTPYFTAPGRSVTVTGYHFAANSAVKVTLSWNINDPTAGRPFEFSVPTDSTGHFSKVHTVPAWFTGDDIEVSASDSAGNYALLGGLNSFAANLVRMGDTTPARGSVQPVSGNTFNNRFQYSGHPRDTVILYVDTPKNVVGSVKISRTGRFFTSYHVSSHASGRHRLYAYDPTIDRVGSVVFRVGG